MDNHFKIPYNFKEPGYVFKGMVPLRNFIDAVVLGCAGALISSIFAPKDFWDGISWYILCAGFPAVFGIVGIHGIPLSTYLLDFIMWSKRRDPYFFNHHGNAYNATAADVMLEAPQLRDHLAAAYDSLRQKLEPKQTDYIEGETFQFAEDPELIYLQNADEDANKEPETAEDNAPPPDTNTPAPALSPDTLDFDNIIDNITLIDSEEP